MIVQNDESKCGPKLDILLWQKSLRYTELGIIVAVRINLGSNRGFIVTYYFDWAHTVP